jgi:hypothetical protein
MFIIEDEIHAEPQKGQYQSFEQALEILKERAEIPWNEKPNRCPCASWKTCERKYQIIEYDDSYIPWKELGRRNVLKVSAKGIKWFEII